MRVLHLFSNWKWTGPAEPALNLCLALREHGHEILFACATPPGGSRHLVSIARERGLEPELGFLLSKHFQLVGNIRDVGKLKRFLENGGFEIIHVHQMNDHLVGGVAARRGVPDLPIIRSSYDGEGLQKGFRNRLLLSSLTDGLILPSQKARLQIEAEYSVPSDRIWVVEGAVDTDRFDPSRVEGDLRTSWGLASEDVVVGVVARIQPRRRFDVFLDAVAGLMEERPWLKVVLIGRGSKMEETAVQPVQRLGIADRVVFPGYLVDEYVQALASIDIKVFLEVICRPSELSHSPSQCPR